MSIKRYILDGGPVRHLFNYFREFSLKIAYYNLPPNKHFNHCFVFCVDGRLKHGGLADRLFGIICTFALCKIYNIKFKILYNSPFSLDDYLIPNQYDWRINDSEISFNLKQARPVIKLGDLRYYKKFHYYYPGKQIHFYSNYKNLHEINVFYKTDYTIKSLFDELFKPSERFQKDLEALRSKVPLQYISVCFRLQNRFGDLKEAKSHELSISQQEKLIKVCIDALMTVKQKHNNSPILITSDSVSFLSIVSKTEGIYKIPGKVVHMDYTSDADFDTYEKSFLDFYMLGYGEKVYQFKMPDLWVSGFPRLAAYLGGVEYELLNLT
jgi:hypothetical protein